MGEYSVLSFELSTVFGECNSHKIQDADASVSSGMEEESVRTVPGNDPWQNVPNVWFDRDDSKVKLNYNWDDNRNCNYAVPAFLRESSLIRKVSRTFLCIGVFQPSTDHSSCCVQR